MVRLALLGWLAVAALATAGSLAAVNAIGAGITGVVATPLSPDQVDRELASATPAPSATRSRPAGGTQKGFRTAGGSVVAVCTGAQAQLTSWSPAQSFRSDDVEPGPAEQASIKFKSEEQEIRLVVTCRDGVPELSTSSDD